MEAAKPQFKRGMVLFRLASKSCTAEKTAALDKARDLAADLAEMKRISEASRQSELDAIRTLEGTEGKLRTMEQVCMSNDKVTSQQLSYFMTLTLTTTAPARAK